MTEQSPNVMGSSASAPPPSLSSTARVLVLVTAFLGWLFAGVQLSITSLAMRSAAIDLLGSTDESLVGQWFAWYTCAFLLGAASGGLLFGWLGDRVGRSKAMAVSILCYSLFSAAAYFCETPAQLLLLRFLCCLGVGGMWPNGVALVAEAWPNVSRPVLAGVIGTSANVGIVLMATVADRFAITPESWRWVMMVGAAPVVLSVIVLLFVPESPRWIASHKLRHSTRSASTSVAEVFRPPLLRLTLVGICLGAVPLIGGWGSANWMMPWSGEVGEAADPPDPTLKARVLQARSFTGTIGSLLGGWIASLLGRRRTYFLNSLAALGISQYIFWALTPSDSWFVFWCGALGFFSGLYFGWLPLCLPEMFPTRVRSTGAGVSFNFGRLLTVLTLLGGGALLAFAGGNYAEIGRITSLIFAVGLAVIWFVPAKGGEGLED